jgi:hypothetical protein
MELSTAWSSDGASSESSSGSSATSTTRGRRRFRKSRYTTAKKIPAHQVDSYCGILDRGIVEVRVPRSTPPSDDRDDDASSVSSMSSVEVAEINKKEVKPTRGRREFSQPEDVKVLERSYKVPGSHSV